MKLGKKNEKKMTEVKKMKKNDSGQPVFYTGGGHFARLNFC